MAGVAWAATFDVVAAAASGLKPAEAEGHPGSLGRRAAAQASWGIGPSYLGSTAASRRHLTQLGASSGLNLWLYRWNGNTLPPPTWFPTVKPIQKLVVGKVAFDCPTTHCLSPTVKANYAALLNGYLRTGAAGRYSLSLTADHSARLALDNKNVQALAIDGVKGRPVTRTFVTGWLPANRLIPLRITYFSDTAANTLMLAWKPPRGVSAASVAPYVVIPFTSFFHDMATARPVPSPVPSPAPVPSPKPSSPAPLRVVDPYFIWSPAGVVLEACWGLQASCMHTYPSDHPDWSQTIARKVFAAPYQPENTGQQWSLTPDQTSHMAYANKAWCLDVNRESWQSLDIWPCNDGLNQRFSYDSHRLLVDYQGSGDASCVTACTENTGACHGVGDVLLAPCTTGWANQTWLLGDPALLASPTTNPPTPVSSPSPNPAPAPKPPATAPKPPASVPKPTPVPSPSGNPAWVALSPQQRFYMDSMLFIFENSETSPQYGYAEKLGDGRGITFGRCGFTTGTGDGLEVVQLYEQLHPSNILSKYLPRLKQVVDSDSTSGLSPTFEQDVQAAVADVRWRTAQDQLNDRDYFNPSQDYARQQGLRLPISKAQLYDAWIQHGYSDPDLKPYKISANGMGDWVTSQLGGSPATGVDEVLWIKTYLEHRRSILYNKDRTWRESVQRVDVYTWLLQAGHSSLNVPLHMEEGTCSSSNKPGPCQLLPGQSGMRLGGIEYGAFELVWPGYTPWLQPGFKAASTLPPLRPPANTACYKTPGLCP